MTGSEYKIKICSSKKFLERFVYSNVKTRGNKDGELELCDCLLEFKYAYILIQAKEKEKNNKSFDDWFNKKVLKKAKNQIKDSINQINCSDYKFYSDNKEIAIDKSKKIKNIIVFEAEDYNKNYRKYYCTSNGIEMNIFSLNEFEDMLDCIVLPSDILDYLDFRKMFYNYYSLLNHPLIIDNISPSIAMFGRIGIDAQVSDYFIIKRYREKGLKIEDVFVFNNILHEIDVNLNNAYNTLEILVSFNRNEALSFVKLWNEAMNDAKSEIFEIPMFIHSVDDLFICLAKPIKCDDDAYNGYFNKIVEACFDETNCKRIHMFEFINVSNDKFKIEGGIIEKEQFKNFISNNS